MQEVVAALALLAAEKDRILADAHATASKMLAAANLRADEVAQVLARTNREIEEARTEVAKALAEANRLRSEADAYVAQIRDDFAAAAAEKKKWAELRQSIVDHELEARAAYHEAKLKAGGVVAKMLAERVAQ